MRRLSVSKCIATLTHTCLLICQCLRTMPSPRLFFPMHLHTTAGEVVAVEEASGPEEVEPSGQEEVEAEEEGQQVRKKACHGKRLMLNLEEEEEMTFVCQPSRWEDGASAEEKVSAVGQMGKAQ